MLPKNISFVDVETSTSNVVYGKIIEIGILRVENNRLVASYSTLINPQTRVDPFILGLTGIREGELVNAPTFSRVSAKIRDILKDSVFVAHNVRFDYSFLRNEFKRLGENFSARHFCTIKLSRLLYPGYKNYNLDSIIENFNITCVNRHRAIDDATVLWELYRKSLKTIDKKKFTYAINLAMKRPTVPLSISEDYLDKLPEVCGVYIFYDRKSNPLYIGKSINIRDRVLSHFSSDHLSAKEMKISQYVKSIETIPTAGELGALFLESKLVKKHLPIYNRQLRLIRKMIVLHKTENREGYFTVSINTLDKINIGDLEKIVGIFRSKSKMKDCLFELARKYSLCYKLLDLEKGDKCCFAYHLGRCRGACKGEENCLKYNLRFTEAFCDLKLKSWPFSGPIIITEKDELEEQFVFDRWCYLGSVKSVTDGEISLNKEYDFDFDTYKILLRYLGKSKNLKNIRKIDRKILSQCS